MSELIAQSSKELLGGYPCRELMLIAGKDGVGKTCACISIAWWVEQIHPDARFYIIDSENKIKSALMGFGPDVPKNIIYYRMHSMNEITETVAKIMAEHRPGDWLAVESMGPIWDQAQDLATQSIAGVSRVAYMDAKKGTKFPTGIEKKGSPVPGNPEDYWKIAKGAYDSAFLDPIRQSETLNVILTSIAKPIKEQREGGFKESKDRKAFRAEVGMDCNLSGSPTMPSVVETLVLLELSGGVVTCRVLRDNLSVLESPRVEMEIPNRKSFGPTFWSECRAGEIRL